MFFFVIGSNSLVEDKIDWASPPDQFIRPFFFNSLVGAEDRFRVVGVWSRGVHTFTRRVAVNGVRLSVIRGICYDITRSDEHWD